MPPAIERLKRRSDFLRIAASRCKLVTPGLILQAMIRKGDSSGASMEKNMLIRIGYTASKKVGGAVERNRARRRLRAVVAKIIPDHAKPGYDFILIARKGTLTRPFSELLEDLVKSLKRLDAYHPV
jgi:ribonuclease P protein component